MFNLKRLPLRWGKLCGEAKEKHKVFFHFFAFSHFFATNFIHAAAVPSSVRLAAWLRGCLAVVCLLIQDNKCLSLGFRQLFTLSWRLRRGPGNWQSPTPFCYFRLWLENVSICPGFGSQCYPIAPFAPFPIPHTHHTTPHQPEPQIHTQSPFVPATVCIISALGFKVSAVALALICHLEVIFIYSFAKSSGNFMMTFRFQGFSRTLRHINFNIKGPALESALFDFVATIKQASAAEPNRVCNILRTDKCCSLSSCGSRRCRPIAESPIIQFHLHHMCRPVSGHVPNIKVFTNNISIW